MELHLPPEALTAVSSLKALSPIRRLPKNVAEKIAAGEVVERPFSVVKELVENSLDAGASTVEISLETGGLRLIQVTDDGHGIAADELPLSLERHATSKIENIDDLWKLSTMGFRGEALASISSISRFTLESRRDGQTGRRLLLEGGEIIKDEIVEIGATNSSGTKITVEHLFYNVPARLKFAKSKASEAMAVRDLLERIALSWPKVSFHLEVDSRQTLNLPAVQTAEDRVAQVLDSAPENLREFQSQYHSIQVRGWFDDAIRGKNSKQIYLSVNQRMVKDKLLLQAVQVALRPLMMEGEYPRLYLDIILPAQSVDVNVHPAKTEIRFEKPQDVFQLIQIALAPLARRTGPQPYKVELAGSSAGGAPTLLGSAFRPQASEPSSRAYDTNYKQESLMIAAEPLFNTKFFVDQVPQAHTSVPQQVATIGSEPDSSLPTAEYTATPHVAHSSLETELPSHLSQEQSPEVEQAAPYHYIGQLKNTYLLFQDETGMILIDQHAAHERIRYEKIKTDFFHRGLKSQPLLISLTVKTKPEILSVVLDAPELFAKLGFEIEAFGDQDLLVRAIPENLDVVQAREVLNALLVALQDSDSSLPDDPTILSPKLERLLSTAACHSSIRAGQTLSRQEALSLVTQMHSTKSANHCPHGRPATLRLEFSEIESLFKRKV